MRKYPIFKKKKITEIYFRKYGIIKKGDNALII